MGKKKKYDEPMLYTIKYLFDNVDDAEEWSINMTLNPRQEGIRINIDHSGRYMFKLILYCILSKSRRTLVCNRFKLVYKPFGGFNESELTLDVDRVGTALDRDCIIPIDALLQKLPGYSELPAIVEYYTNCDMDKQLIQWNNEFRLVWHKNNNGNYYGESKDLDIEADLDNRQCIIHLSEIHLTLLCRIKIDTLRMIIPGFDYNTSLVPIKVSECIIRGSDYPCIMKRHITKQVSGIVCVLVNGQIIEEETSLLYCNDCKKYYMSEYEYKRLKQKGIICCQIIERDKPMGQSNDILNLAQRSLLMNYGYSVDSRFDITKKERQTILSFLMENNIVSTVEVKTFIEWLIKFNGSKKSMKEAVLKWEEDLFFIRNYKKDNVKIRVSKIYL